MSQRELKRVALDFDWPLHKVWQGFINPWYEHCHDCAPCEGHGSGPMARQFELQWYGNAPFDAVAYGSEPVLTIDSPVFREAIEGKIRWADELVKRGHDKRNWFTRGGSLSFQRAVEIEVERMFILWRWSWSHQLKQADVDALIASDRLFDLTRDGHRPRASEVNAWSMSGAGHDAINQMICVEARCDREGFSEQKRCVHCKGNGSIWYPAESKAKAETWKPLQPPAGPGWQLWETTSEGSPISPIFRSAELLAEWCAQNATAFADQKATREQWMAMFGDPDRMMRATTPTFRRT